MIDIHCHILQEIDDGAKTLEESMDLLKRGMDLGFHSFILTSHYHRERGYFSENYEKSYMDLLKEIEKEKLNIKIYPGREIYLGEDYRETLKESRWESLNGSRYILIEFSPLEISSIGMKKIKEVIELGYIPILAHCERYINFKIRDYMGIKKLGGYLQVNIGSLGKNKKLIKKLIELELIDFLGSDVHRVRGRNYELQRELKTFKKLMGRDYFNRGTLLNGEGVIQNDTLKKENWDEEKKSGLNGWFISMWKYLFRRTGVK
ncbi:tyrosine-protein phosphatase [Cetobacterium ceti]